MSEKYTIEARSFKIPDNENAPTVAAHNFWVLKNEKNEIISQLHGLATDRSTNQIMPIGYWESKHSLRAYQIQNPKYMIRENQPTKTVFTGDKEDVLARWNKAVSVISEINKQDLNYPSLGVKFFSKTINSNSVYQTFGQIMDIPVPEFEKGLQPGLENNALPQDFIQQNKYHKPNNLSSNIESDTKTQNIKQANLYLSKTQDNSNGLRDITSLAFKNAIQETKEMMQNSDSQTKNRTLS
jgi:hypothetical protein